MLIKKRVALGLAGLAIGVTAISPAFVSAGADSISTQETAAVSQDVTEDGARPDGFRRFGRFKGGHGVVGTVLQQFDVDRAQLREAMEAVRDQFQAEERPQFERPLSDEDRAGLEAYRAERNAALAAALGIPAADFQAAIDQASEERMQRIGERRSTRQTALAEALGITVEELQAALEQARETVHGTQ